jgi:Ala-tRNA(Pro) deacylase
MSATALRQDSAEGRMWELLHGSGTRHRVIDHRPEGRTDTASRLRGHPLRQAAKSIVLRVRCPGRGRRYALAVVCGDDRVDLEAVSRALGGTRAGFADSATAERLTGCVSGSVIPFSFHPELELLADPSLLDHGEIFFNAARLDRSIALDPTAYRRLARPRVVPIADENGSIKD